MSMHVRKLNFKILIIRRHENDDDGKALRKAAAGCGMIKFLTIFYATLDDLCINEHKQTRGHEIQKRNCC